MALILSSFLGHGRSAKLPGMKMPSSEGEDIENGTSQ